MNARYPTMTAWPKRPSIGAPIFPDETRLRYIAQSILFGFVEDPLPDTAEQAADIINWYSHAHS